MIIYGSSLSPFVRKVLVVAAEKGIEVEMRPMGAALGEPSEEFLEASPVRKMPAIRDGDFLLADSSAIVHYLEAKVPDPVLIPTEARARGRTIWFEEYADTIMMPAGAKIFFNRVVAPKFLKREGDETVAAAAERDEMPPIFDYLETAVPSGDGYLVGDSLTLADIAIASPFATLGHAGMTLDQAKYPRLTAFTRRILKRPSFAGLIERERALLERVSADAT